MGWGEFAHINHYPTVKIGAYEGNSLDLIEKCMASPYDIGDAMESECHV